jgi:hypothetical protein
MIEIIRYIAFSLLGIIVLVGIYNQLESKPFKFEKFESEEEAEKYLAKHYSVGSDAEVLFKDLKKVGAKYEKRNEKIPPQEMGEDKDLEYDAVYVGGYLNNLISLNPIGYWKLYIFVNKDNKIALISAVLTF